MFPFLFGLLGIDVLMMLGLVPKEEAQATAQNNLYAPFSKESFKPSLEILEIKGKIEGFKNTAYKYPGDPVTVGTGLTYFSDGSKPVLGKYYNTDFLNRQLIEVSKVYINRAKTISKKSVFPTNQKIMDVIYYLCFNGFVSSREESLLKIGITDSVKVANWLLTPDGIGRNFLYTGDKRFFVGIVKSRFILANYLAGRKWDNGLNNFLSQFPKNKNGSFNQVSSADLYNAGRVKIPIFF